MTGETIVSEERTVTLTTKIKHMTTVTRCKKNTARKPPCTKSRSDGHVRRTYRLES